MAQWSKHLLCKCKSDGLHVAPVSEGRDREHTTYTLPDTRIQTYTHMKMGKNDQPHEFLYLHTSWIIREAMWVFLQ